MIVAVVYLVTLTTLIQRTSSYFNIRSTQYGFRRPDPAQ